MSVTLAAASATGWLGATGALAAAVALAWNRGLVSATDARGGVPVDVACATVGVSATLGAVFPVAMVAALPASDGVALATGTPLVSCAAADATAWLPGCVAIVLGSPKGAVRTKPACGAVAALAAMDVTSLPTASIVLPNTALVVLPNTALVVLPNTALVVTPTALVVVVWVVLVCIVPGKANPADVAMATDIGPAFVATADAVTVWAAPVMAGAAMSIAASKPANPPPSEDCAAPVGAALAVVVAWRRDEMSIVWVIATNNRKRRATPKPQ
ncbi:hypothetical protein [Acidisphaera sp. L21]|uniref:hypothetical protein n=1 Tax=Acidisphaera sp. L21 TaxID=1641851 RepID=UPI00131EBAF5|nr:hypothetical protein [Acidisphaera sp. L21]